MRRTQDCLPSRKSVLTFSLFLCMYTLRAGEAAKTNFDLPADLAERSIKRLSRQSGVDVLLPTNLVREVRTNAVKGRYTAREALDSMLDGTGFVSARDGKTGALTVRRETGAAKENGSTTPIESGPARRGVYLHPLNNRLVISSGRSGRTAFRSADSTTLEPN